MIPLKKCSFLSVGGKARRIPMPRPMFLCALSGSSLRCGRSEHCVSLSVFFLTRTEVMPLFLVQSNSKNFLRLLILVRPLATPYIRPLTPAYIFYGSDLAPLGVAFRHPLKLSIGFLKASLQRAKGRRRSPSAFFRLGSRIFYQSELPWADAPLCRL